MATIKNNELESIALEVEKKLKKVVEEVVK
jgi:hypothetical protein